MAGVHTLAGKPKEITLWNARLVDAVDSDTFSDGRSDNSFSLILIGWTCVPITALEHIRNAEEDVVLQGEGLETIQYHILCGWTNNSQVEAIRGKPRRRYVTFSPSPPTSVHLQTFPCRHQGFPFKKKMLLSIPNVFFLFHLFRLRAPKRHSLSHVSWCGFRLVCCV